MFTPEKSDRDKKSKSPDYSDKIFLIIVLKTKYCKKYTIKHKAENALKIVKSTFSCSKMYVKAYESCIKYTLTNIK